MSVRLERTGTPEVDALLALAAEPGASPLDREHARVFVARGGADGGALGLVALAPGPDDFAELVRLVVLPAARRQGVARRLLLAAESWARVQRIRTLRFRVDAADPATAAGARALGFTEVDSFGAHVGDDSGTCFAKAL
ncbi:GNAT family N-acetyltransferase [Rathayibacter sp. VKM Ac-2630]|uniref:GNAT family N-acetyltransferase n=1 Tax=Rathayibacter sp. VKM Ac-2630 TaxID=1938617 RepID=UPI001300D2FE|nr:GNAT family N-acetyltransferase [Rathayibacter sp. VKM Ac-2630]